MTDQVSAMNGPCDSDSDKPVESTIFDNGYTDYWKSRVRTSMDGSRVADEDIAASFIAELAIRPDDRVLDLGCGFGRLFPVLNRYTSRVIGVDVSPSMLDEASRYPYACLVNASGEETRLPTEYIHHAVCWASFDVMEQELALKELNRILRTNGLLLITGKNWRYHLDDECAFVAERNAKLKNFPNHFTDIASLFRNCGDYGFRIWKGYAFERRGDFGKGLLQDISAGPIDRFYEYLLVMRKTGCPSAIFQFSHEYF